jgi:hypothetical protein
MKLDRKNSNSNMPCVFYFLKHTHDCLKTISKLGGLIEVES